MVANSLYILIKYGLKKTTVTSFEKPEIISKTSLRPIGSRADVGSSSKTIFGL